MARPRGKSTAVAVRTETADQATDGVGQLEERFWRCVDRNRDRSADKDPEAESAFIAEVVEEVRRERYGRERQTKSDD